MKSSSSARSSKLLISAVMIAAVLLGPVFARAQKSQSPKTSKLALYATVGDELVHYELDAGAATLTKHASLTLPAAAQYAWPHPSRKILYVAWGRPSEPPYGVTAFGIDPASGALKALGQPASLSGRPLHLSTDGPGAHLLVASPAPSAVTVFPIAKDGTLGTPVKQQSPLDLGFFAHQVRVDSSNNFAFLMTRGSYTTPSHPGDPGAIKVFRYRGGALTNLQSIAPPGGTNFTPRHLDFHPSRPWVFVGLEGQNQLQVYRRTADGSVDPSPAFTTTTLADPAHVTPDQHVSAVHVHPNGRFVYVANRHVGPANPGGMTFYERGEDSIAVFAVDSQTGEPTLIQNSDAHGMQPRTFSIDPTGRILVVANQAAFFVRKGRNVSNVPAGLSVFRIGADGKLEFVQKYDVVTDEPARTLVWSAIVALP